MAALAACSRAPTRGGDASPDAEAGLLSDIAQLPDTLPGDQGVATIGESCRAGCLDGLQCESALPEGGMCTKACTKDADCGGLGRCIGADGSEQPPPGQSSGSGTCHLRCNVRSIVESCRESYVCRVAGKSGYCAPDCRVKPCDGAKTCDAASGLCVDSASGSIGERCGKDVGTCDGTPNGVCLALGTFFEPFCTIPCAPFTKPCPTALAGAACVLGGGTDAYCAFICDPDDPKCPSPDLTCQSFSNDLAICTPKKQ
ncbi:MAG: hypothetical protein KC503_24500 [Myxococcales bacterium]|nr:hypothetical protein [Myxococcales bacterium]